MKHLINLISALLALLTCTQCFAENIFWGIQYFNEKPYYIVKVDLQAKGVVPLVTPDLNGGRMTTSKFINTYGLKVGINTGYFDIGNTNYVHGFFMSNGVPYAQNLPKKDVIFVVTGFDKQNHYIVNDTSKMYNAFSASHTIISDGKIIDYGVNWFTDPYPRTAAGIDKTGRYFYLVVAERASFNQISQKMVDHGVSYAVLLDGGGSSSMAIAGKGLVNSPSDGSERLVATHLGFYVQETCTPSEEVCNNVDDDCDNEVDEDGVCDGESYVPPDEINPHENEIKYQALNYSPQSTDINGDGKADLCARSREGLLCAISGNDKFGEPKLVIPDLSNEKGWNNYPYFATIHFADINGDKKADVCAKNSEGIVCWTSDGSTFKSTGKTLPFPQNGIEYVSTIRFADINGDKKDDFCARFPDKFKCFLSDGNSFKTEVSIDDLGDQTGWNHLQYSSTIRMADVDGDGKADLCARGLNTIYCWFSNGKSWSDPVIMQSDSEAMSDSNGWNAMERYSTIRLADVNGDGKADLCAHDDQGIRCQLSKGRAPFGPVFRGPDWAHANYDYNNYATEIYGDLNGDGKADFCTRDDNGVVCQISNGKGVNEKSFTIADFSDAKGWDKPQFYRTMRIADINGDGRMDICGRGPNGVVCYTFNGKSFNKINGPKWLDPQWKSQEYYSTFRIGGPFGNPCSKRSEICNGIDDNCNGKIDEDLDCSSQTPEIPENPEVPTDPETPEIPENPELPTDPETPEIPENPELPTDPETPETPENPELPTDPETPNTPDDSDDPDDPNAGGLFIHDSGCSSSTHQISGFKAIYSLFLLPCVLLLRRRKFTR